MSYKFECFSAAWCPNCTVLKDNLDKAGISYTVIDCDTDEGMSKASALGIRALPVTVISYEGSVVRTIVGLQPIATYVPYMHAPVINEVIGEEVALNG